MNDPFAKFMENDMRIEDDVPLTDLMEEHIFNSYLTNQVSVAEVKQQFYEFDLVKAVNILVLTGIKTINAPKIKRKLKALYLECNQFSNWNLDEPKEKKRELETEFNNIEDDPNVFLLDIIRLRILYINHNTEELKSKQYALLMLNPATDEGALYEDAVMGDIDSMLT